MEEKEKDECISAKMNELKLCRFLSKKRKNVGKRKTEIFTKEITICNINDFFNDYQDRCLLKKIINLIYINFCSTSC